MESRFEFTDGNVRRLIKHMIKESFPTLDTLEFATLYDHKKRMSGGKLVLARVKKANDELKVFTEDEDCPNGVHVVFFFDYALFAYIDKKDKKRLIYHELCHVVPSEKDENDYNVVPHDFEGFYSEIDYNKDDPEWKIRMAGILESHYEKE